VVVAGRFHTHLDLRTRWCDGQHALRCSAHARAGHRELNRAHQPPTSAIGDRHHRRSLADIDGNNDRGRRDWSTLHRHNNTSGACQENQSGANAQVLDGIFDNPFLTPPEAFVKDYLNSYQPTACLPGTASSRSFSDASDPAGERYPAEHMAALDSER
jgi:hypothetical protein